MLKIQDVNTLFQTIATCYELEYADESIRTIDNLLWAIAKSDTDPSFALRPDATITVKVILLNPFSISLINTGEIDDNEFLKIFAKWKVAQLISETYFKRNSLTPRRADRIKQLFTALMSKIKYYHRIPPTIYNRLLTFFHSDNINLYWVTLILFSGTLSAGMSFMALGHCHAEKMMKKDILIFAKQIPNYQDYLTIESKTIYWNEYYSCRVYMIIAFILMSIVILLSAYGLNKFYLYWIDLQKKLVYQTNNVNREILQKILLPPEKQKEFQEKLKMALNFWG